MVAVRHSVACTFALMIAFACNAAHACDKGTYEAPGGGTANTGCETEDTIAERTRDTVVDADGATPVQLTEGQALVNCRERRSTCTELATLTRCERRLKRVTMALPGQRRTVIELGLVPTSTLTFGNTLYVLHDVADGPLGVCVAVFVESKLPD